MSMLTELKAVNIMLSNIGQSPITDLDSINPQVSMARSILDEVCHALQSEGWTFNTETHYPFNPSNGYIEVPHNVLSLDGGYYSNKEIVIREGKLYDKRAHAYVNEPIELDVVWHYSFDDQPAPFKNYVAIRAANLFATRAIGSTDSAKYSQAEENLARANIMEYETQQGDYNMLGTSDNEKISTYSPFNTINR
nr:tail tubular protein A [uncultured Mediterranean phage uvMED]BAR25546.1 tail tubular protein A [uncultured Mediterranean phage uvMED]